MSLDRIVLGPNLELVAEAREAWPIKPRQRQSEQGGKWSAVGVELAPLMGFFAIVNKIGQRARERGELGEGGSPVWSIAEWQRFIRAAREESHPGFMGSAIVKTVLNVETMLADGKNARDIHVALFWRSRKDDAEQERVTAAERLHAERTASSSFESAVGEKLKDERARVEARRRAREEGDESTQGRRRVAV